MADRQYLTTVMLNSSLLKALHVTDAYETFCLREYPDLEKTKEDRLTSFDGTLTTVYEEEEQEGGINHGEDRAGEVEGQGMEKNDDNNVREGDTEGADEDGSESRGSNYRNNSTRIDISKQTQNSKEQDLHGREEERETRENEKKTGEAGEGKWHREKTGEAGENRRSGRRDIPQLKDEVAPYIEIVATLQQSEAFYRAQSEEMQRTCEDLHKKMEENRRKMEDSLTADGASEREKVQLNIGSGFNIHVERALKLPNKPNKGGLDTQINQNDIGDDQNNFSKNNFNDSNVQNIFFINNQNNINQLINQSCINQEYCIQNNGRSSVLCEGSSSSDNKKDSGGRYHYTVEEKDFLALVSQLHQARTMADANRRSVDEHVADNQRLQVWRARVEQKLYQTFEMLKYSTDPVSRATSRACSLAPSPDAEESSNNKVEEVALLVGKVLEDRDRLAGELKRTQAQIQKMKLEQRPSTNWNSGRVQEMRSESRISNMKQRPSKNKKKEDLEQLPTKSHWGTEDLEQKVKDLKIKELTIRYENLQNKYRDLVASKQKKNNMVSTSSLSLRPPKHPNRGLHDIWDLGHEDNTKEYINRNNIKRSVHSSANNSHNSSIDLDRDCYFNGIPDNMNESETKQPRSLLSCVEAPGAVAAVTLMNNDVFLQDQRRGTSAQLHEENEIHDRTLQMLEQTQQMQRPHHEEACVAEEALLIMGRSAEQGYRHAQNIQEGAVLEVPTTVYSSFQAQQLAEREEQGGITKEEGKIRQGQGIIKDSSRTLEGRDSSGPLEGRDSCGTSFVSNFEGNLDLIATPSDHPSGWSDDFESLETRISSINQQNLSGRKQCNNTSEEMNINIEGRSIAKQLYDNIEENIEEGRSVASAVLTPDPSSLRPRDKAMQQNQDSSSILENQYNILQQYDHQYGNNMGGNEIQIGQDKMGKKASETMTETQVKRDVKAENEKAEVKEKKVEMEEQKGKEFFENRRGLIPKIDLSSVMANNMMDNSMEKNWIERNNGIENTSNTTHNVVENDGNVLKRWMPTPMSSHKLAGKPRSGNSNSSSMGGCNSIGTGSSTITAGHDIIHAAFGKNHQFLHNKQQLQQTLGHSQLHKKNNSRNVGCVTGTYKKNSYFSPNNRLGVGGRWQCSNSSPKLNRSSGVLDYNSPCDGRVSEEGLGAVAFTAAATGEDYFGSDRKRKRESATEVRSSPLPTGNANARARERTSAALGKATVSPIMSKNSVNVHSSTKNSKTTVNDINKFIESKSSVGSGSGGSNGRRASRKMGAQPHVPERAQLRGDCDISGIVNSSDIAKVAKDQMRRMRIEDGENRKGLAVGFGDIVKIMKKQVNLLTNMQTDLRTNVPDGRTNVSAEGEVILNCANGSPHYSHHINNRVNAGVQPQPACVSPNKSRKPNRNVSRIICGNNPDDWNTVSDHNRCDVHSRGAPSVPGFHESVQGRQ